LKKISNYSVEKRNEDDKNGDKEHEGGEENDHGEGEYAVAG